MECLFVKSDVSSEADIRELVQRAIDTYGKLDCAFNNAGIDLAVKPLHEQSIEDFDKIMSVNARGLFLCMKYEIQQMLTQGSGAIVNNSSTNGLVALPGISPYVASKHAVMGLTRCAALDYAKQGIRSMLSIRGRSRLTSWLVALSKRVSHSMILGLWFQWVGLVRQRKLLKRLCFSVLMLLDTLQDNLWRSMADIQ